ncbi:MAG: DUF2339 domain-containing protein, partial [Sphingomonadales bacterium]
MEAFYFLLAMGVVVGLPIVVLMTFLRVGRLGRLQEDLARRLSALEKKALGRREAPKEPEKPLKAEETAPEEPLEAAKITPGAPPEKPQEEPAASAWGEKFRKAGAAAPPERPRKAPDERPDWPRRRPEPRPARNWEKLIAERWMVWLGGLALALGGGFLVKYSIDMGLIGPKMRIFLGLLAAAAMITSGEWVRRKGSLPEMLREAPDYVPTMLTAAGVFTAYATIFAAQTLYDLIPAIVAFGLLAAVGFLAMLLALAHGTLLAYLGLIGAFAVPLIIHIGDPNAVTLFGYLFVVVAGSMEVLRYRDWPKLAWTALGLSFAWVAIWYMDEPGSGGEVALYSFGLALAALFLFRVYIGRAGQAAEPGEFHWFDLATYPAWHLVAIGAAAVGGFALFAGTHMAGHSTDAIVALGAFVLLIGVSVRRDANLDILLAGVGVLAFLVLANWSVATPEMLINSGVITETESRILNVRPFVPIEFHSLATAAAGLAALFFFGGFGGLWGAKRPGYWAMVSVAAPLAFMVLVYWRIHGFTPNPPWGYFALGVAAVFLLPAGRIAKFRAEPGMDAALGAYAVGVTTALALAFAMMLENAWLTVALAVELPAVAWIWTKLKVTGLRRTALVLAAIVLVRLVLNPYTLDYSIVGTLPGVNWLLYGYGLPALAFYAARLLFRRGEEDRLQDVLEAGA